MSTFDVRIVKIEAIEPIEGADRVELARVGLYRSVVPKDEYVAGELALYIPEQAIVPDALLHEIGLEGKLAGSRKNRVKAMRFRGALSQGIVCRPKAIFGEVMEDGTVIRESVAARVFANEANLAKSLGITKWAPVVPASMNGVAFACPDLIRWIDIENVKRYPNVFEPREMVLATEKIHGTACCITLDIESKLLYVTSKGMGSKGLAIEASDRNVYWRAVKKYDVAQKLWDFAFKWAIDHDSPLKRIGLFGEVYGKGIQDLHYGTVSPEFAVFDLLVESGDDRGWLNYREMLETVDLPLVPLLFTGPYNEGLLLDLASGKEQVSGDEACIREGVVVRPLTERYSDVLGGRAILKFVSADYLTRKAGTEYE